MHAGRIVETGPTQSIYRAPRHPATLELLASNPNAARTLLDQETPAARSSAEPAPVGGCSFANRCALRAHLGNPDRCVEEVPLLTRQPDGALAACHFSDRLSELGGPSVYQ
jgi:oligopeptide/dipeptide ABC transporter ATP-binding protein